MLIILGWFALLKPAYPPIPVFPLIVNERKIENDEGLGGVCHCLLDAKRWSGRGVPSGTAAKHPVNLSTPRVGALILMHQSPFGHAGMVVDYDSDSVKFKESGWYGCSVVDYRTVPRDSDVIRGYWW